MKALAVLMFLLGVAAYILPVSSVMEDNGSAKAVAVNYAIYRNAAIQYAVTHPSSTGTLPTAALGLPTSWQAMRGWQNRIAGNRLYVYGQASTKEALAAQRIFRGSFAVGVNRDGKLHSLNGKGITLPSFIPDNNLTTVIEFK